MPEARKMMKLASLAELQPGTEATRLSYDGLPYIRLDDMVRAREVDKYVHRVTRASMGYAPFAQDTVLVPLQLPLQRAWYLEEPAYAGSDVVGIVCPPDTLSGRYLVEWLHSRAGNVSVGDLAALSRLELPVPPYEEQLQLVVMLLDVATARLKRRITLIKANQLVSGALQATADETQERTSLGSLASIQKGRHIPRRELKATPDRLEFVTAREILGRENRVAPARLWLPEGTQPGTIAAAGSTLIIADASDPELVGRSALLERDVCCHPDLVVVSPREPADALWLSFLCQQQRKRWQHQALDSGTRVSVHVGRIRETSVPAPSATRRAALGAFLSQAESWRGRMLRSQALIRSLQAAVRRYAFETAPLTAETATAVEEALPWLSRLETLQLSDNLQDVLDRAGRAATYFSSEDIAGAEADVAGTATALDLLVTMGFLMRVRVGERNAYRRLLPRRDRAPFKGLATT